jgi:hypothetical protein
MFINYDEITLRHLERISLFVQLNKELAETTYENFAIYGFYWNTAPVRRTYADRPDMRNDFYVIGSIYTPKDSPRELHALIGTRGGDQSVKLPPYLFDDISDDELKEKMTRDYQKSNVARIARLKMIHQFELQKAQKSLDKLSEYERANLDEE